MFSSLFNTSEALHFQNFSSSSLLCCNIVHVSLSFHNTPNIIRKTISWSLFLEVNIFFWFNAILNWHPLFSLFYFFHLNFYNALFLNFLVSLLFIGCLAKVLWTFATLCYSLDFEVMKSPLYESIISRLYKRQKGKKPKMAIRWPIKRPKCTVIMSDVHYEINVHKNDDVYTRIYILLLYMKLRFFFPIRCTLLNMYYFWVTGCLKTFTAVILQGFYFMLLFFIRMYNNIFHGAAMCYPQNACGSRAGPNNSRSAGKRPSTPTVIEIHPSLLQLLY